MSVNHAAVMRDPRELKPNPRNSKIHTDEAVDEVVELIDIFGFTIPILIEEGDMIIAGHKRQLAAIKMGLPQVPTISAIGWTEEMIRAYCIADNRMTERSDWDATILEQELAFLSSAGFDGSLVGFGPGELDALIARQAADAAAAEKELDGTFKRESNGSLSERFGIPPFSVLNAREGWWQDRKRAWIALGIRSEIGRGMDAEGNIGGRAAQKTAPGRSPLPAANYSKSKARGDGAGRPIGKAK